jgi:hypothetical protein
MLHWTRWGALALAGISGCDGSGWAWGLVLLGAASLFVVFAGTTSERKPRLGDILSKFGPGKRGTPIRAERLEPRRRHADPTATVTGQMATVGAGPEPELPAQSAPEPDPSPRLGDDVQFTVYRPDAIAPEAWTDFLVFAHLARPDPDAPGAPDPLAEVRRLAEAALGQALPHYSDLRADAAAAVPREGELVLVPTMESVRFHPPERRMLWLDEVHGEHFKMRASAALDGSTARGRLLVRLGAIVLADIPLAIPVTAAAPPKAQAKPAESAAPYRRIFASYSHRDVQVVHQFERYAKGIGDRYLRDVVHLRAGEVWTEALERLIDEADVFQLFWSDHAMRSPYVRKEWEYALGLGRQRFVRPTYWTRPLPEDPAAGLPPQALRDLEFGYIGTEDEGSVPSGAPPLAEQTSREVPAAGAAKALPEAADRGSRTVTVSEAPDGGSFTLSAGPDEPGAPARHLLLAGVALAAVIALVAWAVQQCAAA